MMTEERTDEQVRAGLDLLSDALHPATMAAIRDAIERIEPRAPWMRLCPKCNGQKQVYDEQKKEWVKCPNCDGTGWWGG